MGFFNKFKSWFSEKEEVIEPIKVEDNLEVIHEGNEIICEHCNMPIYGDQKVKTYAGKKFHVKPCFRSLMKQAKGMAFN